MASLKLVHFKFFPKYKISNWFKTIWTVQNHFGPEEGHISWLANALSVLLWVQNDFGQVEIIKISPEKSNMNLTKMILDLQKDMAKDFRFGF